MRLLEFLGLSRRPPSADTAKQRLQLVIAHDKGAGGFEFLPLLQRELLEVIKWKTAHERLRRWTVDRTRDGILDEVIVKDDAVGNVEWVFSIDSSSVRAHQHAAGARKRGVPVWVGRSMWQSKVKASGGGLTSKIHLAVDGRGLPMSIA